MRRRCLLAGLGAAGQSVRWVRPVSTWGPVRGDAVGIKLLFGYLFAVALLAFALAVKATHRPGRSVSAPADTHGARMAALPSREELPGFSKYSKSDTPRE